MQKKPQSKFCPIYHKASAVLLNSLALVAGSTLTFGIVCVLILAWAVAGIFVHDNQIWQISMQVMHQLEIHFDLLHTAHSKLPWVLPKKNHPACLLSTHTVFATT